MDFAYEVSRAIAACEGALLIVDASQGIQAQTLANLYLAMEHDLEIIPVLNKIDLPIADVPAVTEELVELARGGRGRHHEDLREDRRGRRGRPRRHRGRVPAPKTTQEETRGLVFDSYYDPYRGVVSLIRLVDGELKKGDEVRAMGSEERFELLEVGCYTPKPTALPALYAGEVGYVIAGLKDIEALRVGDTVTRANDPASEPLPGYAQALPMVFSGLYPTEGDDFERLREALWRSCSSTTLRSSSSRRTRGWGSASGAVSWGCLHMEIIQERLEREFDLDLIASSPSVRYEVVVDGRGRRRSPTLATCRSSSMRSGSRWSGRR